MSAELVDFKMNENDKSKALDAAIGQIEKAFGKGSVMKLGQRDSVVDIQAVSTGSLGLDIALGIGGFPKGRIIEIYGHRSGRGRVRHPQRHNFRPLPALRLRHGAPALFCQKIPARKFR